MNILCIQTGGTIDKDYPNHGVAYAFEIAEPAVKRIFKAAAPSFTFRTVELLKKDSTDLTHEDRQLIREVCEKAEEKHILITHGTDTMIDTAQALDGITGKTIIITGSMRPERFVNSDAAFNVGTAVGALSAADDGIYVAMSGRVLPWKQITKDYDQNKFVEVGKV